MLDLLLNNLILVAGASCALLGTLAALHAIERRIAALLFRRIGWRASLYPTAIVGVPLHELSHLVAAKVFGHRIVGYSLFEPEPSTGTLGYVRHAYRRRHPWQLAGTFFIGIAPFVAGAGLLLLIGATMLPDAARLELLTGVGELAFDWSRPAEVLTTARALAATIAAAVGSLRASPWLPLQLYLAVAVASHMAPSPKDLAGGVLGGLVFSVLVAVTVTVLTAAELSLAPLLLVLLVVAGFATLAVCLQSAYVIVVAVLTRPVRRSLTATRGSRPRSASSPSRP